MVMFSLRHILPKINRNASFSIFRMMNDLKTPVSCGVESSIKEVLDDAQKLGLTENIRKYGISIKEALKLDTSLEKRIVLAGIVKSTKKIDNEFLIEIQDCQSCDVISVTLNQNVRKSLMKVNKGSSIVISGFVYKNPAFDANQFHADLVLYFDMAKSNALPYFYQTVRDYYASRSDIHLRPLSLKNNVVMRIQSYVIQEMHSLMHKEFFYHIQTPCLTSTAVSKDVFEVIPAQKESYFETPVYLNSDAELHLETMVPGLLRVYTINQGFTAHSQIGRLNSAENLILNVAQIGTSFDEMLTSIQNLCQHMASKVYDKFGQNELKIILDDKKNNDLLRICKTGKQFIRLTYEDAKTILKQKNVSIESGEQLISYHYNLLSEYFENYPIFITHFPISLKRFNVAIENQHKLAFELIFPNGIKVASGSLKEINVDKLKSNLQQSGLQHIESSLDWYFESKSLGHCSNYGFQLNMDKFLMMLCRLPSVRDAITFPRLRKYCPM